MSPPKIIVGNQNNGHNTYMIKSIPIEEEEPHLYMDYGMAKFLICLFFFAGFFAGAVAITMAWIFSGPA